MEHYLARIYFAQACGKPGCPLCRVRRNKEDAYLHHFLEDHAVDGYDRRDLFAADGFCRHHAARLVAHDRAGWQSERKTALVYEQVLEQVLADVEQMVLTNQAVLPAAGRPRCPACRAGDERELIYLDLLVGTKGDPMVQVALATADPFCQEHFARLLMQCTNPAAARRVIQQQYRSLETVEAVMGATPEPLRRKRG